MVKSKKEIDREYHNRRMFGGNKQIILERDNFECQLCGLNQEQHILIYGYWLIVHHKDGNGKGKTNPNNFLSNLITLCRKCHTSLHNRERIGERNPNYGKSELMKKISKSKKSKDSKKNNKRTI